MIPVNLAVEDALSEAVLRRLLTHTTRGYAIGTTYGRVGFGYLRKTIAGWNRAAKGVPFVVLTDLDEYACPRALIEDWLSNPVHPNLLFRVAVREVESWLISDTENFAKFIGCSRTKVPGDSDRLSDAKGVVVQLARASRLSEIRSGIVPKKGSTAQQGPDYNGCLIRFVNQSWDINAAAKLSASLARTLARFREFTPVWEGIN